MDQPIIIIDYDRKKYKPKEFCECGGYVHIIQKESGPIGMCTRCKTEQSFLIQKYEHIFHHYHI